MVSAYSITIISAWYLSNIGVILLNKYLLSVWEFSCPIFLTMCHVIMCALMTMTVRVTGVVPKQTIKCRSHAFKISILALVFVASVVAGNISLRFIPVSFNQAIGATTPLFTALLSHFMLRHKESTYTYFTLVPIVLGVVIASRVELLFHPVGFVACLLATFARALKSVLQGLLLTNAKEKLDSLNLLMYMSPVALIVLFVFTNIMEPEAFGIFNQKCAESPAFFSTLVLNCIFAVCANLTNFLVTKCTSPLTLQVLGNAKGLVAVVVSIILFRNPVSRMGMMGYGITCAGVMAYAEARKRGREVKLLMRDK